MTDLKLSEKKKEIPEEWDAGLNGAENKPGFYGRKPGVNAYGYFYGDKPSGSNWNLNRKEDFAEFVAMYCGWGRNNPLSRTAHGRIERYLLPNGVKRPDLRHRGQLVGLCAIFLSRRRGLCKDEKMGVC